MHSIHWMTLFIIERKLFWLIQNDSILRAYTLLYLLSVLYWLLYWIWLCNISVCSPIRIQDIGYFYIFFVCFIPSFLLSQSYFLLFIFNWLIQVFVYCDRNHRIKHSDHFLSVYNLNLQSWIFYLFPF